MSIRNLEFIRGIPQIGDRLYEALSDLNDQHQTLAQQVNGNGQGQPAAPAQVAGLTVTAQDGHFTAAISDPSNIYRGIQYYIEHADNPHFINPIVEHLGDSRNWHGFFGNTTRYFRAYSSYSSSPPSAPVYHGTVAQPTAVTGGGSIGGPAFQPSQGSGTGAQGVGLQGPGTKPFRSATGAAPVR